MDRFNLVLDAWLINLGTNIYSLLTPRQWKPALSYRSLLPALTLLICGCSTPSLEDRINTAEAIARTAQLHGRVISSRNFNFKVYQRHAATPQQELVIYIEGDGRAWASRRRISDNPTPINPVALQLAARDPSPALAYIARPCQYQPLATEPHCNTHTWTDGRYSREVVQSFMEVVSQLKSESASRRLGLVGFSGGGTIAALLASQRRDVAWLVTVAGNLNPDLWTQSHGISPLTASLNPVDQAQVLEHIHQLHLLGSEDKLMPAAVAESYLKAMRRRDRIQIVTIPGQNHGCCWQQIWPQPLCENIGLTISSC